MVPIYPSGTKPKMYSKFKTDAWIFIKEQKYILLIIGNPFLLIQKLYFSNKYGSFGSWSVWIICTTDINNIDIILDHKYIFFDNLHWYLGWRNHGLPASDWNIM